MSDEEKEKLKSVFGVDKISKITGEMIFNHSKELAKDKALSKALWQNVSDFSGTMKDVINCFKSYLDGVEVDNSKGNEFVYKSCYGLLTNIDNELKSSNINDERKDALYKLWMQIIEIIKDQDLKNKKFHLKKTQIVAITLALFIGGGIKLAYDAGVFDKLLDKAGEI